ncbi:MAG: serine hydrolase [Gemmatimonadales bacterium]
MPSNQSIRLTITVLIALTLLLFQQLTGQARPVSQAAAFSADADRYIQETLAAFPMVPGIVIAVVRGEETVYAKGFGLADVGASVAATAETDYYIASSTKSFTSLAAALLHAQGKLDLDRSLQSYLPEVVFDSAIEADSITLRDLLTHSAGISNDAIVFRTAISGEHTRADLLHAMSATEVQSRAPRGEFRYTNLGYNIVSVILDREAGMPWQDLLATTVFEPAGLDRTTAYASVPLREGWPVARPYWGTTEGEMERLYLEKQDNTMQAAGGMYSTAQDLGRWVALQLNDGELDGRQIFPADVIRETHRPHVETDTEFGPYERKGGYGLGWYIGGYDGKILIHHFGGFAGWRSHVSFMPEYGVGVVVLANQAPVASSLTDLFATYAYDWWLDRDSLAQVYTTKRDELAERAVDRRKRVEADLARRSKREWTLTEPLEAYTGTYRSDLYGTLTITIEDDVLAASIGNLHAVSTPFTRPNTIRVELIPKSGQVIGFTIEDGAVVQARASGADFQKVASE